MEWGRKECKEKGKVGKKRLTEKKSESKAPKKEIERIHDILACVTSFTLIQMQPRAISSGLPFSFVFLLFSPFVYLLRGRKVSQSRKA
jgi:hypothetical protein